MINLDEQRERAKDHLLNRSWWDSTSVLAKETLALCDELEETRRQRDEARALLGDDPEAVAQNGAFVGPVPSAVTE